MDVKNDTRFIQSEARRSGRTSLLRDIETPRVYASLYYLFEDLALLILSIWLFIQVPMLFLISLLLAGRAQRGLANLLHDSSHGNLFRNAACNELLGSVLLAPISMTNFIVYKSRHLKHHAYLGDSRLDPDFLSHHKFFSRSKFLSSFLLVLTDVKSFRQSIVGDLFSAAGVHIVLWWGVVIALLASVIGVEQALLAVAFYFMSRGTVYHSLQTFAELTDHGKLSPMSIAHYSRDIAGSPLAWFLHPHNDAYHCTHHLLPRVPLANLPRAHRLVLSTYKESCRHIEVCRGYFLGSESVLRTWNSNCVPHPVALANSPCDEGFDWQATR